ncbi:MAG TPA: flagellar biosynthesis anti-sigma factor FlgM [Candidatus Acidoferrum sp.]|nr:flagellar biosynthesis anti-sigma factor FlgM [Candidatus Acidoferrum sp.]
MKIDPNLQPLGESQPDRVSGKRNGGVTSTGTSHTTGLRPATGDDTVSLSSTHGDVQQLTTALQNVPEVRTDKVNALQQQVQSGQYIPDNGKLADALLSEQASLKSKA